MAGLAAADLRAVFLGAGLADVPLRGAALRDALAGALRAALAGFALRVEPDVLRPAALAR